MRFGQVNETHIVRHKRQTMIMQNHFIINIVDLHE
ncbi:hypothetical protein GGU45_002825 [Niabella hirudinis]